MTTRRLTVFGTAILLCATLAQAQVSWRWTADGGRNWTEVESDEFVLPADEDLVGETVNDNIIEFLEDCTFSKGIGATRPVTLRTKPGVETRTLTVKATYDKSQYRTFADTTVSNLVFNGDDKVSSLFTVTEGTLRIGSGCTIRNFKATLGWSTIIYIVGSGNLNNPSYASFEMLPGSRLTACTGANGGGIIVLDHHRPQLGPAIFDGCVIDNCTGGGININQHGGVVKVSGRALTAVFKDVVITDNVSDALGAVEVRSTYNDAKLAFCGSSVIRNNFDKNHPDVEFNVHLKNATDLIQCGDLAADANIGLTFDGGDAVGVKFGARDSEEYVGADMFHSDADEYHVGQADGKNLVWREIVLSNFAYTATGWGGEADGQLHSPSVEVTDPSSPDDYEIVWAVSKDGPYSEAVPGFSDPGEYVCWFKLTAAGYRPATGSVIVRIVAEGAEIGYRYTDNGGRTWYPVEKGTPFTVPPFNSTVLGENVVEFISDCTYASGIAVLKPMILRTRPGLPRCTLSCTANVDQDAFESTTDLVVSNLVFNGGGYLACLVHHKEGTVVFGGDTVVSNYIASQYHPNGVVVADGTATVKVNSGARFTACATTAGAYVICAIGSGASAEFKGAILDCNTAQKGAYDALIGGVVAARSASARLVFSDTIITGNTVKSCGAVRTPSSARAKMWFGNGNLIVKNFDPDADCQANVCTWDGEQIMMQENLTGGRIGVTCATATQAGEQFGVASGAYSGALVFHADAARLVGSRKQDKSLVWAAPGLCIMVR